MKTFPSLRTPSSRDAQLLSRPMRVTLRRILLTSVVGLHALAIPWYRDAAAEPRFWLGLPDWVAVAVGCYAAAATLNAVAWLLTDLEDPGADEESGT